MKVIKEISAMQDISDYYRCTGRKVALVLERGVNVLGLQGRVEEVVSPRGAEGRRWPWGDAEPERWQLNADPAHLRRTNPVGVFPGADAPNGVTDLAGNVWQWTGSLYADRIDAATMTKPAGESVARRAVRGGSWLSRAEYCRAGYRDLDAPVNRGFNLGFRVVCCPILEP